MICWTLGITEHHNAVDNVLVADQPRAAHRPRRPLRLRLQSAARPEQRAGRRRHGRDSQQAARLPGHRAGRRARARSSSKPWGVTIQPQVRLEPHRDVRTRWTQGARRRSTSSARTRRSPTPTCITSRTCSTGLDHLVVQEIFLTKTARAGPRRAARRRELVRGRGHRHQQRAPRAARAQGSSSRPATRATSSGSSRRSRGGWATTGDIRRPKTSGTKFRVARAALRGGMSYARLEELGGLQWPCPDEIASRASVPARPAVGGSASRGRPAPFSVVSTNRRSRRPDDEYPFLLTTGRRLESYNTGVQTGGYDSPLHSGETLDISPEDAERLGIETATWCASTRGAAASRRRRDRPRRCARASCS